MNNHRLIHPSRRRPLAGRLWLVLLAAVLAVSLSAAQETFAQSSAGTVQGTVPQAPAGQSGQEDEGSHELSSFFLIGIMINIVALALFIAWAAREWKRKKPAGRAEER